MPRPKVISSIEMTRKNCYARGGGCESCYDPRKCYGCSTKPDLCYCGEDSEMSHAPPMSCFPGNWVLRDDQPSSLAEPVCYCGAKCPAGNCWKCTSVGSGECRCSDTKPYRDLVNCGGYDSNGNRGDWVKAKDLSPKKLPPPTEMQM